MHTASAGCTTFDFCEATSIPLVGHGMKNIYRLLKSGVRSLNGEIVDNTKSFFFLSIIIYESTHRTEILYNGSGGSDGWTCGEVVMV